MCRVTLEERVCFSPTPRKENKIFMLISAYLYKCMFHYNSVIGVRSIGISYTKLPQSGQVLSI